MSKKVCLDAGHYAKYNRSPVNGAYYESKVMWKMHLLQKKYLEEYGIEVILTRSDQTKDRGLYDRGAASKGCDLFISSHSNAVGSSGNESVDYPVAFVPLNGKGNDIGNRLTKCVQNVMGTNQDARINTRKNSSGGEYYGVIRGAVAVGTVGIILEHSFHTNTRITNWLLNDSNLDKLARAEADVIAEYLNVKKNKNDSVKALSGYVTVTYKGSDGLNIRTEPRMGDNVCGVVTSGTYAVSGVSADGNWYKIDRGYITANKKYVEFSTENPNKNAVPFSVKVSIDNLNIRTGAGTNYAPTGHKTGRGTFTIVEVKEGPGSDSGWGRLKSGAGWISLGFAKRID